jgi:hypothetical protein
MTTPPEQPTPDPSQPFGSPQPPSGQPPYGQPPYGQPQYAPNPYGPSPQAPYGIDPATGIPYSDKSRIAGGILQLFLGTFGAGRWYTGHYGIAVAQLVTCGGLGVWALIDAILMLIGNVKDPQGRPLHP